MDAAFDVSICVSTFGDESWVRLAEERAIPSAEEQGVPVIHCHGETLAQARNECLALVQTEYHVNLDADDQLDENYITEMAKGTADLRAPSRLDVRGNVPMWPPYMPRVWAHEHQCVGECLRFGNWMTIGTAVKTELARSVGGWEEFGWSEDYALFARCWKAGGTVEACPDAIYRAWWTRGSRNRVSHAEGLYWHREIEKAVWPEEPSIL